jgi:hypothetical protein
VINDNYDYSLNNGQAGEITVTIYLIS